MTGRAIRFAGVELVAWPSGALYWPRHATLIVADLHLEKGSSLAGRGRLLPPYDSRATLAALEATLVAAGARRVVCLGDSFHDDDGPGRLAAEDRATLARLGRWAEWLWIGGNHDRRAARLFGAESIDEVVLEPLTLRHSSDPARPGPEISGHLHPQATVAAAGRRLSGRCFALGSDRLVLPAFGAYAGGLDVFDAAFAPLLRGGFDVLLLGYRRLHAFASRQLHRPAAAPRQGRARTGGAVSRWPAGPQHGSLGRDQRGGDR